MTSEEKIYSALTAKPGSIYLATPGMVPTSKQPFAAIKAVNGTAAVIKVTGSNSAGQDGVNLTIIAGDIEWIQCKTVELVSGAIRCYYTQPA